MEWKGSDILKIWDLWRRVNGQGAVTMESYRYVAKPGMVSEHRLRGRANTAGERAPKHQCEFDFSPKLPFFLFTRTQEGPSARLSRQATVHWRKTNQKPPHRNRRKQRSYYSHHPPYCTPAINPPLIDSSPIQPPLPSASSSLYSNSFFFFPKRNDGAWLDKCACSWAVLRNREASFGTTSQRVLYARGLRSVQ